MLEEGNGPMDRASRDLIASSEVMRANAKAVRTFRGHVVGKFERAGPNSWDPYRLVALDGPTVDVPAGIPVQVEDKGVRIRFRAYGAVHVAEWRPTEDGTKDEAASADWAAARRAEFLETCVGPFQHKRGIGATAFIAKTLSS